MTRSAPRDPIIAIVGTTGTGKSQLAVSLAERFNGEIINADAVQMYAGLRVITNKISAAEQRAVPHHLLGCIGLEEETWMVKTFVEMARKVIQEIRSRGRVPIIVGGTHYYTKSLLFKYTLASEALVDDSHSSAVDPSPHSPPPKASADYTSEFTPRLNGSDHPILSAPTHEMLAALRKIDPIMADRWHPNDARKIRRGLEIYLQSGKRASDIYDMQEAQRLTAIQPDNQHVENFDTETTISNGEGEQQSGDEDRLEGDRNNERTTAQSSSNGLRDPTLVLWTYTPRPILRERLHARVDTMVSAGLIDEALELEAFARSREKAGHAVDRTRGVYIAIGYKELLPYLHYGEGMDRDESSGAEDEHRKVTNYPLKSSDTKEAQLRNAIDQIKSSTWQYAKSQERWLRALARLLRPSSSFNPMVPSSSPMGALSPTASHARGSIYALNAASTQLDAWAAQVLTPAVAVTAAFLNGTSMPDARDVYGSACVDETVAHVFCDVGATALPSSERHVRTCDVCGVTATTEGDWVKHRASQRHRRAVAGAEKRRIAVAQGYIDGSAGGGR